jgi:hypothetical protein
MASATYRRFSSRLKDQWQKRNHGSGGDDEKECAAVSVAVGAKKRPGRVKLGSHRPYEALQFLGFC